MSDFRYLLTVLGNGRTQYLERTLAAIEEHLFPQPAEVFVFDDSATRLGQCAAMAKCWEYAAASEYEFVLMFEEDYVCLCPINVREMAQLMNAQPHLLQLTLMRQAWASEVPFGSYIAKDPGWYEQRDCSLPVTGWDAQFAPLGKTVSWMETRRNWANAPTLLRTSLAREFPWPTEPGCETTIGPRMLERYPEGKFGIRGRGQIEVAHIGVERGPHSHGY